SVLVQVCLLPHAEAPHHVGRRLVAGVAACIDPVQTHLPEGKGEQTSRRLGRVPKSLRARMEDVTYLGLLVAYAAPDERDLADQAPIVLALDCEENLVSFRGERDLTCAQADRLGTLLMAHRIVEQVARHLR